MSRIGGGSGLAPVWKENGRVRVDHRFLWPWYRTLDERIQRKGETKRGAFCSAARSFFLEAGDGLLRLDFFLL
jgi:hypothetical protein